MINWNEIIEKWFFLNDEKLMKQQMKTIVKNNVDKNWMIIEKLMKLIKTKRILQNAIDTIEQSKLIEKLMLTMSIE